MPKLSVATVRSAKPGRHADGQGLYLLVKPTGARSWLLRVQVDGKRRDIGLGGVDLSTRLENARAAEKAGIDIPILERSVLTLADAREKAGLLRKVAKSGRDPVSERDKDRRSPPTFKSATETVHGVHKSSWTEKTADAFLSSLKTHAYPVLGNKRVDHIEVEDIAAALKPIWKTSPEMAKKVRHRIGTVLNYCHARKWRQSEAPVKTLSILLGNQPDGDHMAAMPFADVPDYYQNLASSTETVGRLALMFVIATAARSQEVRLARWSQIDLENRLWNRPAAIMKGGVGHSVTLNDAAVAVLKRAETYRRDENDAVIFPAKNGKALSDNTVSKIMRDAKLAYVPHGFRSSFRDWAAEKMPEIPDPVAEAALAHAVPDKVVKAYKRTTFMEMRRKLMQGWSDYLDQLREG